MEATGGHVPELPRFAFQLLNAVGDLFQIIPAVQKSDRPQWQNMSAEQVDIQLCRYLPMLDMAM